MADDRRGTLDAKTASFVNDTWDDSIIPELCNYIRVPNKSPSFDPDWEATRAHGNRGQHVCRLVPGAADRRACRSRSCDSKGARRCCSSRSRATSDDVVLLYGHLRQATRIQRLGEDLVPWEPVHQGRQAVRARRRRRRLRGLRFAHRDSRAAGTGHSARALRRADRGLRGKRQLRPAVLHRRSSRTASARRAWSCASTPSAAITSSSGARHRCAATWSATCASRC